MTNRSKCVISLMTILILAAMMQVLLPPAIRPFNGIWGYAVFAMAVGLMCLIIIGGEGELTPPEHLTTLRELTEAMGKAKEIEENLHLLTAFVLSLKPVVGIKVKLSTPLDEIVMTSGKAKGIHHRLSQSDGSISVDISTYSTRRLTPDELKSIKGAINICLTRTRDIVDSMLDQLTGLGGRKYLEHILTKLRGTLKPVAVMMLDLDHFKEVNDTYGHEAGDRLLKEVAKRIKGAIRNSDIAVRYGGDEFVVILRSPKLRDTYKIAYRIAEVIKKPPIIEGIPVSASIGVAYKMPGKPFDPEKALRQADLALYRAKEQRDKVAFEEA